MNFERDDWKVSEPAQKRRTTGGALFGRDEALAVAEVKSRKGGAGFATLERWLAEYDALFLRRNNADPFVLLLWRIWARILEKVRQ